MRRSIPWRFVILSLAISSPAVAQVIWDMPNVIDKKVPADRNPPLRPRTEVWPRLDPGSVVCKTEADLLRLAESRRGVPGDRPNCQLIREATAIHIERRVGPGRTEVTLTDQNGLDGWTDAWLPDRAPPLGGKAVSIK